MSANFAKSEKDRKVWASLNKDQRSWITELLAYDAQVIQAMALEIKRLKTPWWRKLFSGETNEARA